MARIDGGELLVRSMQAEGIEALFSISDISQSPMLRSVEASSMRHVGPRHESAAGHMAEAWARATGRMAAVAAAAGPGVANLVPALMCAWKEGFPMLAIGTQRVRRSIHAVRNGRFQHGPQLEVVRPVTKFAERVEEARHIPEFVRAACRAALDGRCGPVYLDIPADVLREEIDEADVAVPPSSVHRFSHGAPDPSQVNIAAEMLAASSFPLILAGHGAQWSGASEELVELAEHIGAVVMTTPGARGIFPEDHPLSVGMGFPWGSPVHLQSDVILAVGTQIGETMQFLMPPGWAGPASQKLIHLDADATNIGANRPTDVGLVGDAKAGLAALADALRAGTPPRQPVEAASSYARDYQLLKRGLVDNYGSVDSSPVHPGRLASELVTFLPEDAIVCVDGGNTGLWAHLSLTFRRPRSLLWTGHFGHLGTGLPYAIGAKLARPDRPVFLFSGDGAFGFNLQELETAARENVKLVAVVNCDSAWGMEVIHMQKVAGTNIGVELGPVRYDQVAKGLGCHGEYVESSSDLRGALERALATDLPAVVHVAVDPEENTNPPGLDDFASMYAAENT